MQTIAAIYFSPTGNTKKIIHAMLPGDKNIQIHHFNISLKPTREKFKRTLADLKISPDFWIFGSPVYSGQLPVLFKQNITDIQGEGRPAAGIVTYGNKSYGIAPSQMQGLLIRNGFNVIALAAFIGEHSYCEKFHVGLQRPNGKDLQIAKHFGQKIFYSSYLHTKNLKLNGKIDFTAKLMPEGGPKPFVNPNLCKDCRICINNCPTQAIDPETKNFKNTTAKKECISCMSCVKRCPVNASSYHIPFFMRYLLDRVYFRKAKKINRTPVVVY